MKPVFAAMALFALAAPATAAPRIDITGPEETVYSWNAQRCENEDIPDLPTRAFRAADGTVNVPLAMGWQAPNRRLTGTTLDIDMKHPCGGLVQLAGDGDPSKFNNNGWIASTYTEDGQTVYALLHHEFYGSDFDPCGEPNTNAQCTYYAILLAKSIDGGATYTIAPPPGHLVATYPYVYDDVKGNGCAMGYSSPSNIVKTGGYYYAFFSIPCAFGAQKAPGVGVMRTTQLDDPTSWRCWNGKRFANAFTNPYERVVGGPAKHVCTPIAPPVGTDVGNVTFNTALNLWMMVSQVDLMTVAFRTSSDLVHWSYPPTVIRGLPTYDMVCPTPGTARYFYQYFSLLDPESPTRNFETTGSTAYLYVVKQHTDYPTYACNGTLNRDLVRFPVTVTP